MTAPELDLLDWRRRVNALYAAVRADRNPEAGHAWWRSGRDELFRTHPQSPLPKDDPLWKHPKITIMPHASRRVEGKPMVPRIADAVRRLHAGQPIENLIDRTKGY